MVQKDVFSMRKGLKKTGVEMIFVTIISALLSFSLPMCDRTGPFTIMEQMLTLGALQDTTCFRCFAYCVYCSMQEEN